MLNAPSCEVKPELLQMPKAILGQNRRRFATSAQRNLAEMMHMHNSCKGFNSQLRQFACSAEINQAGDHPETSQELAHRQYRLDDLSLTPLG